MSDPIKEFTRRLEVTDEVEIAAFRWLQQVGAIPEHHKPESSNIRLGVYSKQKDAIQTEAITKGINPEMPFGVNTPDLFWAHIHAFVVDWHRDKMPRVERLSRIRTYANAARVSLRDSEAKIIDSEAQRQYLDLKDGFGAGDVINISPVRWIWEQIFALHRVNLLLAREKTGKTALVLAFLAEYLGRSESFLGRSVGDPGKKPAVIILGTDQSQTDWGEMLLSTGMVVEEPLTPTQKMANRHGVPIPKCCRLRDEIKWLFTAEAPCFLDEEGIEEIGELARQHPGAC